RDLIRRAFFEKAAASGVKPLGVFPHDDKVDMLGAFVLERSLDAGVKLDRPEVDVLVQLKAEPEQDALFENAWLDVGVTDGAEVNGVKLPQLLDGGVGQSLAGAKVTVAAEIKVHRLVAKSVLGRCCLDDLEAFPDDLGAGAIAGNDRDLVHNRVKPPQDAAGQTACGCQPTYIRGRGVLPCSIGAPPPWAAGRRTPACPELSTVGSMRGKGGP